MEVKKYCILFTIITVLYCEFIADYVTTMNCYWPQLKVKPKDNDEPLRAMILADTHLLGPIRGHWLDKFYREWHMKNAFQAAIHILKPDIVFVLGDLFDEGDIVNHQEFEKYVRRFHEHFKTPSGVSIISAVGNHDVGFHYKMHPFFTERFEAYFNNTGVNLYTIKGMTFVFINSMAMENDGCYFCDAASNELKNVAEQLNKESLHAKQPLKYSRPIVLQHFPTYRVSDKSCREHDTEVIEQFRENWEVLSQASTDMLGKMLKPRLAFSGHSHNYCHSINRWGVDEYTVASFSWRNKVNPSFLLATLTPNDYAISKCDMLKQSVVYNMYYLVAFTYFSVIMFHCYEKIKERKKQSSRTIPVSWKNKLF